MTDIFRIIFSALSPVAALIMLLLVIDRHDKEPAKLLIFQFIAGCLISIPAIFIEGLLERFNIFSGTIIGIAYTSFIVAGLTEESLKRTSVYIVSYHKPAYNEKLDGIIYCAFASLGFAAVENIMYIINFEAENPSIALYRGIFSVPGHMLFAVTMGYYISLSKFAPTFALMRSYKIKSLLYPVLLHGTFNFILSLNIHWLFAFVPFVIFLWIFNIKKLRTFSKESRYYKNLYNSNNYNNRN